MFYLQFISYKIYEDANLSLSICPLTYNQEIDAALWTHKTRNWPMFPAYLYFTIRQFF